MCFHLIPGNAAKTYFDNLKKRYNKKRNAVKAATKSGAGRDDVLRHEVELKKYEFLSWLNKHIVLRESKTNIPDFDDFDKDSLQENESVGTGGGYSDDDSTRSSSNELAFLKSNKKSNFNNYSTAKPKYGIKRKNHAENDDQKEQIASLLKTMNRSFEERRNNNVPLDSEYHFAVSLADDLRRLPERQKQIAKHEIQSVIFKYQTLAANYNYSQGSPYNPLPQTSQTCYSLPSPPPFTPTITSPLGIDIGSTQSQIQNRAHMLGNSKENENKNVFYKF